MAGTNHEVGKRILANMSERAGKVIQEYLERNKGLEKSEIDASLGELAKALNSL